HGRYRGIAGDRPFVQVRVDFDEHSDRRELVFFRLFARPMRRRYESLIPQPTMELPFPRGRRPHVRFPLPYVGDGELLTERDRRPGVDISLLDREIPEPWSTVSNPPLVIRAGDEPEGISGRGIPVVERPNVQRRLDRQARDFAEGVVDNLCGA